MSDPSRPRRTGRGIVVLELGTDDGSGGGTSGSEMRDWSAAMVDRSRWDQSFVVADESSLVDVFQLDRDDARWLTMRKSTSCSDGLRPCSPSGSGDDPSSSSADPLNGGGGGFCPTIRCSSPSSGPDSGRASTSDDPRCVVYQNGFLAVDGHSSGSSSSESPGCCSGGELCPAASDLIVLDSGAFSCSSSGSAAARTAAASEPLTDPARSDPGWLTTTDAGAAYARVASFLPSWDAERLESAYRRAAACGFYYGRMSMDEATERLSGRAVGAFLLRDSADQRYLFSLSVQTCRGTTSIRMSYRSGLFRLDCSPDQEHLMPTFDCPLRLLAHYVRLCSGGGGRAATPSSRHGAAAAAGRLHRHSYVLLESSGRRDTPVLLIRPYRERPSSLAHLCRRSVQRALYAGGCGDAAVDRLQLMPSLKTYLNQYPYDL